MPSDIRYDGNIISTTDEIEKILQQIRVILGTKPGEVLGAPLFGINLEDYVFDYVLRKEEILRRIRDHVSQFVIFDANQFDIEIDLNFGKDHTSAADYAVLDIIINQVKRLGVLITK